MAKGVTVGCYAHGIAPSLWLWNDSPLSSAITTTLTVVYYKSKPLSIVSFLTILAQSSGVVRRQEHCHFALQANCG